MKNFETTNDCKLLFEGVIFDGKKILKCWVAFFKNWFFDSMQISQLG